MVLSDMVICIGATSSIRSLYTATYADEVCGQRRLRCSTEHARASQHITAVHTLRSTYVAATDFVQQNVAPIYIQFINEHRYRHMAHTNFERINSVSYFAHTRESKVTISTEIYFFIRLFKNRLEYYMI